MTIIDDNQDCADSMRQLRDASKAGIIDVTHTPLVLRTPDVQAPAKPKKEEVTALAKSMISCTSAGRVHTSKGQQYPLSKLPSNEPSIVQSLRTS